MIRASGRGARPAWGAVGRASRSTRMLEMDPPFGSSHALVFGAGARVGSGSVILAGVSIGEHALVGAGSVVTRDIPARAVAFGNPARVRGTAERAAS